MPKIMISEEISAKIRQYTADIEIFYSRYNYMVDNFNSIGKKDDFEKLQYLYTLIDPNSKITSYEIAKYANYFNLDYIVIQDIEGVYGRLIDAGFVKKISIGQYVIFKNHQ